MVKFIYLPDMKNPHRVMTVAYEALPDKSTCHFGYSINTQYGPEAAWNHCTRGDQFSKRIGREVALGRLKNSPRIIRVGYDPSEYNSSYAELVKHALAYNEFHYGKDLPEIVNRIALAYVPKARSVSDIMDSIRKFLKDNCLDRIEYFVDEGPAEETHA